MDLKKLTNTELVKICAQQPRNKEVWFEFYSRFNERILLVISRVCRVKGFTENTSQFHEIIQDLVQNVYMRLLEKNCKALTSFKGKSENSIYTYLGTIATNEVRNYFTKKRAQKRPPIDKSIDEPVSVSGEHWEIFLKDILIQPHDDIEAETKFENLKEKIDRLLNKIIKSRNKMRNMLIFKYYLYEGFSAEEIASQLNFNLSAKTVGNLISKIKKELRKNW